MSLQKELVECHKQILRKLPLAIESATALIDNGCTDFNPAPNEDIATYISAYQSSRNCDYGSALDKYSRLAAKFKLNSALMLRLADVHCSIGNTVLSQQYYQKLRSSDPALIENMDKFTLIIRHNHGKFEKISAYIHFRMMVD